MDNFPEDHFRLHLFLLRRKYFRTVSLFLLHILVSALIIRSWQQKPESLSKAENKRHPYKASDKMYLLYFLLYLKFLLQSSSAESQLYNCTYLSDTFYCCNTVQELQSAFLLFLPDLLLQKKVLFWFRPAAAFHLSVLKYSQHLLPDHQMHWSLSRSTRCLHSDHQKQLHL